MMNKWILMIMVLGLLSSSPALAETGGEQEHHDDPHTEHLNTLGVFFGVTSETRREGSFTLDWSTAGGLARITG